MPSRVPSDVAPVLAESSGNRKVAPRLILRRDDLPGEGARREAWPLRFSDFDTVGHMNNAAYWEVLEEHMVSDVKVRNDVRAVVEHVIQVEPGQSLSRSTVVDDGVSLQMTVGDAVHAAAWVGSLSA